MSNSDDERQARLAQALRDNLRRRKAQARAGEAPVSPPDQVCSPDKVSPLEKAPPGQAG